MGWDGRTGWLERCFGKGLELTQGSLRTQGNGGLSPFFHPLVSKLPQKEQRAAASSLGFTLAVVWTGGHALGRGCPGASCISDLMNTLR